MIWALSMHFAVRVAYPQKNRKTGGFKKEMIVTGCRAPALVERL